MQPNCPSRFKLDQYLHRDLSDDDEKTIATHLESCENCSAYIEKAKSSESAFSEALNPKQFSAQLEAKLEKNQKSSSRLFSALSKYVYQLAALSALLVLSIALFVVTSNKNQTTPISDTTIKGGVSVKIFVKRDEKVFQLEKNDTIKANDALRFELANQNYAFFFLLGIQQDGLISAYIPFSGKESISLTPNQLNKLPNAIKMDASPHDELLVFIFSKHPLSFAYLKQKLEKSYQNAKQKLDKMELAHVKESDVIYWKLKR